MKIKELREKNSAELKKMLAEKKETARSLRFAIASKQIKNNREFRNVKKEIARIMTLINQAK
ncbi:MAG: 50S ribosomal protein L29 [Candidatus Moranbacteria bacterium CG06_land_8_20_14_3_00_40_12]|nr:MAG: 50S ribosomal protein L29 [Candidatus Moranbacteria bacterium CG23_combo_of_CG06-09_8_20_14_all_40_16]PIU80704.1 MAG: 50S ribosomal protein L29 [Candidatus Moranbacteria bacterium CG06_land_8_20_14_3_00_40_12]